MTYRCGPPYRGLTGHLRGRLRGRGLSGHLRGNGPGPRPFDACLPSPQMRYIDPISFTALPVRSRSPTEATPSPRHPATPPPRHPVALPRCRPTAPHPYHLTSPPPRRSAGGDHPGGNAFVKPFGVIDVAWRRLAKQPKTSGKCGKSVFEGFVCQTDAQKSEGKHDATMRSRRRHRRYHHYHYHHHYRPGSTTPCLNRLF